MALRSQSKADTLARVFASKSQLPAETIDCPFFGVPDVEFAGFIAFRSRSAKRLFKNLNERKATGHDMISAVILKKLHDCIAVPFTSVVRRLFYEGVWPRVWRYHIIVPIFEKGSSFHSVCILLQFYPRLLSVSLASI